MPISRSPALRSNSGNASRKEILAGVLFVDIANRRCVSYVYKIGHRKWVDAIQ